MPRRARYDHESCSSMPETLSSAPAMTPPSRCRTRTRCAATSSIRRDGGLTMLLAIDFCNTNTVLGCFEGDKLVECWRIKTCVREMADYISLLLSRMLIDGSRSEWMVGWST